MLHELNLADFWHIYDLIDYHMYINIIVEPSMYYLVFILGIY